MTQQEQELTRESRGRTIPLPGEYDIDPSHSTLEATVRHLMVARVRGRFTGFSGVVRVAEDVTDSSVEVSIEASTIDTGEPRRDGHLRSADFLDVENHPTLEFRSTGIRMDPERWLIDGELTMRGVTRTVTLRTDFLGSIIDHRGRHRIVFAAQTDLDREEFGMTWNQALEAGGVVVGPRIAITLEIQAVRR